MRCRQCNCQYSQCSKVNGKNEHKLPFHDEKTTTLTRLKKDLSAFKLSAQAAQKTSLNDSGKVTFDEGMKKLLNEVTLIEQKAQTQSISEVKTEARKLRSIMEQYHSKLGV